MISVMVDIAQNIRVERARRDWTQQELARRSGVHAVRISQYESGAQPSLTSLRKLADAFNVPLSTLTAESAPVQPTEPAQVNNADESSIRDSSHHPAVNGNSDMNQRD